MALQLTNHVANTLMFATSAIGSFTVQVAVTQLVNTNSASFTGTTIPMSEVSMPAGHMRVFTCEFTPIVTGHYIMSYYAINELGEVIQNIQRGIVSAGSSGGGSSSSGGSSAIGVGL